MDVIYLSERSSYMRHKTYIRENGLAVWRIKNNLWLCSVSSLGNIIWFLSNLNASQVITKKQALVYLRCLEEQFEQLQSAI